MKANLRTDFTADYLRSILEYDLDTGVFTWKRRADRLNNWNGKFAGKRTGYKDVRGYVVMRINDNSYWAHRLAWLYVYGVWPHLDIDHIDGVKDNNRISNLRPVTASQNLCNSKTQSNNTSGFRGVYWDSARKKWHVQICKERSRVTIGRFATIEEAVEARHRASREIHGQYAYDCAVLLESKKLRGLL